MVEVDPGRPGVRRPDQVHRPGLRRGRGRALAAEKGWAIKQDGDKWRRVVASPLPKRIFEIRPISWLLEQGAVVICTGGGGIPTMYEPGTGRLVGAEVVIDKDRASALLAAQLERGPVRDGHRRRRRVHRLRDAGRRKRSGAPRRRAARQLDLPAGSMGPKVEAAIDFVPRRPASAPRSARSAQLGGVVAGDRGTQIEASR